MEPIQIVFLIGAALTLFSAVMVVTRRNLVHAALYLILALFGVAMIFVLLQAYYWAVIQVIVYIGAIAILIIMAIMITRDVTGEEVPAFNKNVFFAALLAVLMIASMLMSLSLWPQFTADAPQAEVGEAVIQQLGVQLFSADGYLMPTLLASILLLAAFVGAIRLAFPIKQEEE